MTKSQRKAYFTDFEHNSIRHEIIQNHCIICINVIDEEEYQQLINHAATYGIPTMKTGMVIKLSPNPKNINTAYCILRPIAPLRQSGILKGSTEVKLSNRESRAWVQGH